MTPPPTEAQKIRQFIGDGWHYSARAIEPRGDHYLPCLVWRKNGREAAMFGPEYRTERAAWAWADQWAERAIRWDD